MSHTKRRISDQRRGIGEIDGCSRSAYRVTINRLVLGSVGSELHTRRTGTPAVKPSTCGSVGAGIGPKRAPPRNTTRTVRALRGCSVSDDDRIGRDVIRPGAGKRQFRRRQRYPAYQFAEYRRCPAATSAGVVISDVTAIIQPDVQFGGFVASPSRLRRRACGLQNGVRSTKRSAIPSTGLDPDRLRFIGDRRHQQSRFRLNALAERHVQ